MMLVAPDVCSIPLPPWVLEEMSSNPDIVYTDRSGRRNPEYISLGCDSLPVLKGRTPIQVYTDYMRSFRERFRDYLGNVIAVINQPPLLRSLNIAMQLSIRMSCCDLRLNHLCFTVAGDPSGHGSLWRAEVSFIP